MRLTENQINAIRSTAQLIFGDFVEVFLFGSRIEDDLKGGDIDLLIHAEEKSMNIRNKALFLVALKKKIGDQKIDVVFDKNNKQESAFLSTIKQSCISLC